LGASEDARLGELPDRPGGGWGGSGGRVRAARGNGSEL